MDTNTAEDRSTGSQHKQEEWLTMRPGERFCVRVPATATGGACSVVELISDPGDSTFLHQHDKEDEYVLVLEGTARIVLGGKTFDVAAGQSALLARGIPHGWGNPTDKPLRILNIVTPGAGVEAMVILAKGSEVDPAALLARFQVTLLGPPILG